MKKINTAISLTMVLAMIFCACGISKPPQTGSGTIEQPQSSETSVPNGGIVPGVNAGNFPVLLGSTANIPLMAKLYSEVCGVSIEDATAVMNTEATTSTAWESLIYNTDDRLLLVYEAPESVKESIKAENLAFEASAIGRDGLVFLVNKNNPVQSLTREQLVDVYSGKVTDWSQISDGSGKITAFQRNETSGSQTMFLKLLMGGTEPMKPPSELVPGMMGALIDGVAKYDGVGGAIGYSVYYYASLMYQNPDIKLIDVDAVAPSNQTIADGSYPLTNEFYAVIRKDLPVDSSARKLRDYLLTADGKKLIEDAGYVALAGEQTTPIENRQKTTEQIPLIDCANLDLLEDVYLKPLGLTKLIGVPWSSPEEIDPDSVLTAYEIKMLGNPVLRQKYLSPEYQYLYPAEEVEAYTSAYFGMTAEQTRKYSAYDDSRKLYVVEMGLGGAWDVYAINAQQDADILHLEYCLVNSYNQTSAYGVMDIRLWADGSYQYLSNRQEDLWISSPRDDDFSYPAPITETADGTVVIDLSGNGLTKMTHAAAFTAKADQLLEYEATGDWQGGAVNLFLLSPDKQFTSIRVTANRSDTILLSGGKWNYNCTGSWQRGDVSFIARLTDASD